MANRILRNTIVFTFFFLGIQLHLNAEPLNMNHEILGNYDLEVKGAPYGYEEGTLSIEKSGGRLESKIAMAGAVFRATKTEINGSNVRIDIYIEGIAMKLDLEYKNSILEGRVTSSSMDLEVYASKMNQEKDALFGAYEMEVKGAPYGYGEGTLRIERNGSRIQGNVEVAGAVFRATKTEVSGNQVLMDIYIEGIPMKLDLRYEDAELNGTVVSTDMNLELHAKKIEKSDAEILGDYDLKVEDAPYGYESGVLTIRDQGDQLQSEVKMAGAVFRAMKTEVDDNTVIITIYIEGIPMKLNLVYDDSKLSGQVTSTDMNLKVTATKI